MLRPEQRSKLDDANDLYFYDAPRFVTHVDTSFIERLTNLYRARLQPDSRILDLMSSWVSIQYLQYPEAVLSEIYRVLQPNGIVIISFSNRMFYQKAIAAWRDGTDTDRVNLVRKYFQSVDGFTQPEVIVHQPPVPGILQMLGLAGGDPFYAVVASKDS